MATNTYTALATTTLGSDVTSFTFSAIPTTYTDLVIVGVFNTNSAVNLMTFQVGNGTVDTAANYSYTAMLGNGTTASSNRYSSQTTGFVSHTQGGTTTPGGANFIANFQNYSNTTANKTVLIRSNQADSTYPATELNVNLWRSTSAINTIKFEQTGGAVIKSGSTFTIYGIAADSGANVAKATGGTITYDQFNVIHTFTSSGTFTPTEGLVADYLVIAGGGGGGGTSAYFPGATYGGGGGAGGYRTSIGGTPLSLTAQNYTVTVGAGGTGGTSSSSTNGLASVFGAIQASGGGRGSSTFPAAGSDIGSNGGSGGGARTTAGTGNSGGYTPVEGYAGYGYANGSGTSTGGGGGASAAATSSVGANGASSSINGTATVRAGGGGGFITGAASAGGSGGGGTAVLNGTGTAGTANTGGGGGAAGTSTSASRSGGAGGSGIVIIRYPR